MGKLAGYRTLAVNILTIVAAALGAVPPEWQGHAIEALAITNIVLRLITSGPVPIISRTWCVGLLAAGLASATMLLSGCTAQSGATAPARNLRRDCAIAGAIFNGFRPMLEAKCARAKDPFEDGACLTLTASSAALAACFVAAETNDVAGVNAALGGMPGGDGRPGVEPVPAPPPAPQVSEPPTS